MLIQEMSKKQLIGALGYYNNSHVHNHRTFAEFLQMLEKSTPWHENAPLLFTWGDRTTTIEHCFYWLYESEELEVLHRLEGGQEN